MRVLLCQLCPPLAVLLSGRPLVALVTPKWWLIPAPLVALGLYGAGHGILALVLMLMWAWPSEHAKAFALITVMNKLQDNRFDRLIKSQERMIGSVVKPSRPEPVKMFERPTPQLTFGADVGENGTRFRRR